MKGNTMSKSITIPELRKEKELLEQDIVLLMDAFKAKTGVSIERIECTERYRGVEDAPPSEEGGYLIRLTNMAHVIIEI